MHRSLLALHIITAGLLALFAACLPEAADGAESPRREDDAPVVVITGANRGLGLEFARQLKARGAHVVATARKPDQAEELQALGVEVVALDVTDDAQVAALVAAIGERPVDMLINNAGMLVRDQDDPAELDLEGVRRTLEVNVLGPMRVTEALLPAIKRGERKRIVNISSGLGSIEGSKGGFYGYRESKAALNMFSKSLAENLREDGVICVAMSPGWVRTDMGGPQGKLSPEESITGMLKVIDGLTLESSGRFYGHDGETLPW